MGFEYVPSRPKPNLIARLLRLVASAIIVAFARILTLIDLVLQRLGSIIKLHNLPPLQNKSQGVRRNVYRIFFPFLFLITFFTWTTYQNEVIVQGLRVPILGSHGSHANLYFPPIGFDFQPEVPSYNAPPRVRARTPLFVPFTRNNTMMRQAVLSYIAAGWPREDIVIVDNSGTMDANDRGQLSSHNPFFLDYTLYRKRYGVSILQTPTLLNFAQLQNFMLRQALARDWPFYFWSHMDVIILGAEDQKPYKSFYRRVLDVLYKSGVDAYGPRASATDLDNEDLREEEVEELEVAQLKGTGQASDWASEDTSDSNGNGRFKAIAASVEKVIASKRRRKRALAKRLPARHSSRHDWAVKFFDFDNLVLVNTAAWRDIGSWDTFIPYYNTDCDFYARLVMNGYKRNEVTAGHIFDIATVIDDPEDRLFPGRTLEAREKWGGNGPEGVESRGGALDSGRFRRLKDELAAFMKEKNTARVGRNTWQDQAYNRPKQSPEPWTYDPRGFQEAWWGTADHGRELYVKKWGTNECNLVQLANKTLDDAWKLQYLENGSEDWKTRKAEQDKWMAYLAEGPIRMPSLKYAFSLCDSETAHGNRLDVNSDSLAAYMK